MNKISVYVKDEKLLKDIKLIAVLHNMTLTELIEKLLIEYAENHKSELVNYAKNS